MTVKELMDILNNKNEIPRPEHAELFFYFVAEDGKEVDLKLKSIGAFSISTDITVTFEQEASVGPSGSTMGLLHKYTSHNCPNVDDNYGPQVVEVGKTCPFCGVAAFESNEQPSP